MSYSKLANKYIAASADNYTRGRGGFKVCKITVHHMACQWSAERCAQSFQVSGRMASANYCIGSDGTIVANVDEENRAWTSSNYYNDCQAITVEVANETCVPNWTVSTKAWNALVNLCVDVCKRYGFRLSYTGNANGSLTEHRMFAATSCPGPYLHSKMNQLVQEVNAKLDGKPVPSTPTPAPKEAIDQILHIGSYVTSIKMKIGNVGLKKINDDLCCYLAPLGGWFPCSMVSKVPYSDGYNDQVLHTTNAVVYVDRVRVDAVNVQTDTVRINGVWVKAGPLTEIK